MLNGLRTVLALVFCGIFSMDWAASSANGAILRVPSQYNSIQGAIDSAVDGDLIRVEPGIYRELIDYRGKSLTIESTAGASQTIIDGAMRGTVVRMSGAGKRMILQDFTVENGGWQPVPANDRLQQRLLGAQVQGGGVFVDEATSGSILDCVIRGCRAVNGGGVHAWFGSTTIIQRCLIVGNSAQLSGGGVYSYVARASIVDSVIRSNFAASGAGISAHGGHMGQGSIRGCVVEGNRASQRGGGITVVSRGRVSDSRIILNSSDDQGGGVAFLSDDGSSAMDRCTVLGNRAVVGGGVYVSLAMASIRSNRIVGNSAMHGGGVYFKGADGARFSDNTVEHNIATECGGGVMLRGDRITFDGNSIHANRAVCGGGVSISGDAPTLLENAVTANEAGDSGGGIDVDGGVLRMVRTEIRGNKARRGGGIQVNSPRQAVSIVASSFHGNIAAEDGGALLVTDDSGDDPHILNSVFVANAAGGRGGALFFQNLMPTRLIGNTLVHNRSNDLGSAVCVIDTPIVLANSILWANRTAGASPAISHQGPMPAVRYCVVEGGWAGEGNLADDPLLVDAGTGDVHLSLQSPCIDTGSNSDASAVWIDFEGDDRIADGDRDHTRIVDIGADECMPELAVRYGTVDLLHFEPEDVLFVNGSTGAPRDRVVEVEVGSPLRLEIRRPPSGGGRCFAIHANYGTPVFGTLTDLGADIGTIGFPFLVSGGANPDAVWNSLGRRRHFGESKWFDGSPIPVPGKAPEILFDLPRGDAAALPVGIEVTLQGVVHDLGSRGTHPLSITNAVVVRIE